MRTAFCFTPDRAFFPPAVRAIASLIEAEPEETHEIYLICEPDDVTPGFDRLAARLRERMNLLTLDFSSYDKSLSGKGRFSRAVFRRLFLAEILPAPIERIISVDSDMLIVRPGLSRLAGFDFAGKPLAAAYDMIFLMDFKGEEDALVRQFRRSRQGLGLALDTPYFNAGMMAIDRAAWRREKLTEQVAKALAENPQRYPFMEQDALNATLKGGFAPLSPRYNFMGDFFLLDLERRIDPIVLHFVNAPKPWTLDAWKGEARFAETYRDWFKKSPWPEWAEGPERPGWRRSRPPLTKARREFAARLARFLHAQRFLDGPLQFEA
ncbi:glycosyltransferase family 8 protein [Roseiarcus sp.]|uniref:glycosyltransferase family 8 protein n=1 Tax=Roseiarcus sp. TaxID=1969460 RepID=UPI003F9B45D0